MSFLSALVRWLKSRLYFVVARYFRFFAQIRLRRWRPRIIVITGSSGKTTLLQLIASQLKEKARYSHHANSTYGIPFDILGMRRRTFGIGEWLHLFFAAPFCAFKKPYTETIYIVEADADRPGEGKFLASLLQPEVVLWTNAGLTHSVNFDSAVAHHGFSTVGQAIAFEFGYFARYAKRLLIVNGDDSAIHAQLSHTTADIKKIHLATLSQYSISADNTTFVTTEATYVVPHLLPKEFFYSLAMTRALLTYLAEPFDASFANFLLAPGRSSVFKGIKDTTIIDSSYNATPDGMAAILTMMSAYPTTAKWLVLGDMIELGVEEQRAHEQLAQHIVAAAPAKVVLVGSRVSAYTYPKLSALMPGNDSVVAFERPKDALTYLAEHIAGGETILFKGARFLEGIVEKLLLNPADANNLCRREPVWQRRRKQWDL